MKHVQLLKVIGKLTQCATLDESPASQLRRRHCEHDDIASVQYVLPADYSVKSQSRQPFVAAERDGF
jgi:hypothetical protein